ncbi:hypothetical protein HDE_05036 [Halotydeus destructor]|nr:hypothetical protein HDE_05036 [Halotydeus destructor]
MKYIFALTFVIAAVSAAGDSEVWEAKAEKNALARLDNWKAVVARLQNGEQGQGTGSGTETPQVAIARHQQQQRENGSETQPSNQAGVEISEWKPSDTKKLGPQRSPLIGFWPQRHFKGQIVAARDTIKELSEKYATAIKQLKTLTGDFSENVAEVREIADEMVANQKELSKFLDDSRNLVKKAKDLVTEYSAKSSE